MKAMKPVPISKDAFVFCKFTMASLFWISLIFKVKETVLFAFIILVMSAFVKVQRAPFVLLYSYTAEKVFPSRKLIIEENSITFSYIVGATFSGAALIFLYFLNPFPGWILTGMLAVLKTSASFGFCGAAKLYTCLNNPEGQCCRIGKKVKKLRDKEQEA